MVYFFYLLNVYLTDSPSLQRCDNLAEIPCEYNKKLKCHYMYYISKYGEKK